MPRKSVQALPVLPFAVCALHAHVAGSQAERLSTAATAALPPGTLVPRLVMVVRQHSRLGLQYLQPLFVRHAASSCRPLPSAAPALQQRQRQVQRPPGTTTHIAAGALAGAPSLDAARPVDAVVVDEDDSVHPRQPQGLQVVVQVLRGGGMGAGGWGYGGSRRLWWPCHVVVMWLLLARRLACAAAEERGSGAHAHKVHAVRAAGGQGRQ